VIHSVRARRARRRILPLAAFAALFLSSAVAPVAAQAPAKKVLTVDDYTRWRSINGAQLSGDGKWVAYVLQFTNTPPADSRPVLHLLRLDTSQDTEIPNATGAMFSSDSRWIAYQVEPSGGRGGRGGRGGGGAPANAPGNAPGGGGAGGAPGGAQQGRGGQAQTPPEPRHTVLRELATGNVHSWQDISSFTFSPTASHLLLRRGGGGGGAGGRGGRGGGGGAPGGGAGAGGAEAGSGPRGGDIILRDLRNGRDQFLGAVADASFNSKGEILAYTVDASPRDGNGLFVIDLQSGRTVPLDNDARVFNRLTWNDDGTAIAVLKGVDVDRMRERDNVLEVFTDVPGAMAGGLETSPARLDAKAAGFPSGWVISDRAALSWSDDNKRIFFGAKPQVAAPDTSRRRGTDEQADVDIWNTRDERIQSVQMTRAEADRNFTFRQAFEIATGRFVKLTDSTMRDLDVAPDGRWAVGRDTRGYISDYERPAADFYRVNTSTGERTLMFRKQLTGAHVFGFSPDGNYFTYWKDNRFQAYNLDAGTSKTLASGSPVSFVDVEYDHPGPKPSYGVTGYSADGKALIATHRYDLWLVPLDGSAPKNLTNGTGTKGEIRFRYVRVEADSTGAAPPGGGGRGGRGGGARGAIDLTKPLTLSAYGEYTKKSGFYELAPTGQLKELVYEDASFSTPSKAAKADVYMFTRQTFVEFPDLRISGPGFRDSKKITDANPQQSEYLWGRRMLFDYKDRDGHRLQGILAIPDDYKPGEKRPMLVNFYEKNSQNMHRYSSPSFLTGMGSSPIEAVTRGYITMLPDVYFHTGSSHTDMLDAVEAAVKKVIEMGYVDPKRIGINGHSYGGEGAAFIGTRSRLFAAVAMGAGVTDLYQDFSQNWGWAYQVSGGSGANGNDYYLYGQGRWGFSPWDKPDVYMFESALTHVREVTAPFLIMHGTADPTVAFQNGLGFYNALRYNGKSAVLLAYPGEGHGLRGLANRKDLTIRYFQFFDHYLKGAPAPKWLSEGVPFLEKDANRDPKH
jgi:dipeptidyl aminopeptidase/acylaminoacyl peptidase